MSYDYWKLFKMDDGPYEDWGKHFFHLKQVFSRRINFPKPNVQEEAKQCLIVLDKEIPKMLEAVVCSSKEKTMTSFRVCFEMLQEDRLDDVTVSTVKKAISGDKDSIIKIYNSNLSQSTLNDWKKNFGTSAMWSDYENQQIYVEAKNLYDNGTNYSKAFNLFKEIADAGMAEAIYHIGLCYLNGRGVEANLGLAKENLYKAKELGISDAETVYNSVIADENQRKIKANRIKKYIVIGIGIIIVLVLFSKIKSCTTKETNNTDSNVKTESIDSEQINTQPEDIIEKDKEEIISSEKDNENTDTLLNQDDNTEEKKDVEANQETEIVESKNTVKQNKEIVNYRYISSFDVVNASDKHGGLKEYTNEKDNLGKVHEKALGGNESGTTVNWAEYKINGRYQVLTGQSVMSFDTRSQEHEGIFIKIYGDDIILYTSPLITKGVEPDNFSIDITGVNILKVSIVGANCARLVDAKLYENKDSVPISDSDESNKNIEVNSCSLQHINYFNASDSHGGFDFYESVTDNLGNTYTNGYGGYSTDYNWCEYRIDSKYSRFTGRVVLNERCKGIHNEDTKVEIYGDDKLLYESPIISAGVMPDDIDLDISDVSSLKIAIVGKNLVRLVDGYLYADGKENQEVFTTMEEYQFPNQIYLGDANWFNSSSEDGFYTYNSVRDNFDNVYSNGISGRTGDDNWCQYILSEKISNFKGRVVLNKDYADKIPDDPVYVCIECDGETVFKSENIQQGYLGEDFDIDTSNVNELTVHLIGKNYARLVDCYLTK